MKPVESQSRIFAAALCLGAGALPAQAAAVTLFDGRAPVVVHDDTATAALAAGMLVRDLAALTGQTPQASTRMADCRRICIVLSTVDSPLAGPLLRPAGIDPTTLRGQWERYGRAEIRQNGKTILLIAGSDRRGMIYGAVDLSREMGVNPWTWWADVAPRKTDRIRVSSARRLSASPSVQYRGIFLNDEDWGLQPWSAKTYDRATGTIGPKTYASIYELLWRLKANAIWPAMHNVTEPFYANLANPKLADDYAIVVGTSHAEPMLRNNVREWNEKTMGPYNFPANREAVLAYWRTRVRQSEPYESLYTVGIRGIHDSPMEGAATAEARKTVLEDVVAAQRDLLAGTGKPPAQTPQVFTVYKEVEDVYNAGLKLPDDITLIWCDDNYGYLTRLSSPGEQKRVGGAGVYYHLSYWGAPHDYLWLATAHPGLIREEMGRAYDRNARKIWIANAGDIKPGEYLTQYFLDLAFDHDLFAKTPRRHLQDWMAGIFGKKAAPAIADIMMRYYDLAFERRPEFMGWDETEQRPNLIRQTAYTQSDGDEALRRLSAYAGLTAKAEAIAATLPDDRRDAYFELVLYPVRAAANLNARILNLDLSILYGRQGRAGANWYADRAKAAQDGIVADTAAYNAMLNGKWRYMMDMAPRRLPVFDAPSYPHWSASEKTGCGYSFFGQLVGDGGAMTFRRGHPAQQSLSLYGYAARDLAWSATGADGIAVSPAAGTLTAGNGYEARLSVAYDGRGDGGPLVLGCKTQTLGLRTVILPDDDAPGERYRAIVMPATSVSAPPAWEKIEDLGSLGTVFRVRLDAAPAVPGATDGNSPLTYRFVSRHAAGAILKIVALPTHPLDGRSGVRIGVSLDGEPVRTLDFATVGRSDEWRENVLSNTAVRTIPFEMLPAGEHRLNVYAIDPGFMLDRIEIDLDGASKRYGLPPQID